MYNHTPPESYILDIVGGVHQQDSKLRPSARVVRALQALDARIVTKRFRTTVLNAIFDHAVVQHFNDDEAYVGRRIARLQQRYGKKRTRELPIERCDILNTWRYRDARFIPDAYLVDTPNWTVVCYEVEDTHPLNPFSIEEEGDAIVSKSYGHVSKRITAQDLQHLPEVQLRHIQVLEQSMNNHYSIWAAVYPQLALAIDPIAKARTEQQLKGIIASMKTDLDGILNFLVSCGLQLDDHYMNIRNVVQSV